MYKEIRKLADDALALQNKDRMDAALREISALCDKAAEAQPTQPADKPSEFSAASFAAVVDSITASGEKITADPDLVFTVSMPADAANAVPAPVKTKKGGAK